MHALAAAALLLAHATPLAEDPAFQHAIELYESVELEKAAEAFEGLKNDERPPGEKALIHAWRGLTLAQLGRSDEAKQAFVDAVTLVPDVHLPAAAPPGVEALLEEARQDAKPKPAPEPEPAAEEPAPVDDEPVSEPGGEGLSLGWNVWTGAAVAATGAFVLAPIGAYFAVISYETEARARDPDTFHNEAEMLADQADFERAVGFTVLGVGVAALVGGVVLAFVPLE